MGADSEPWHMKIRTAHGLSILLHVYRFQAITWRGLDQNTSCFWKPQKRVTSSTPNCLFFCGWSSISNNPGILAWHFQNDTSICYPRKETFESKKGCFCHLGEQVCKNRNQALFSVQLFDPLVNKTAHTESLLSLGWDCWTTSAFQGQR